MLPFLIILPTENGSIPEASELAANGIVISSAMDLHKQGDQQTTNSRTISNNRPAPAKGCTAEKTPSPTRKPLNTFAIFANRRRML